MDVNKQAISFDFFTHIKTIEYVVPLCVFWCRSGLEIYIYKPLFSLVLF